MKSLEEYLKEYKKNYLKYLQSAQRRRRLQHVQEDCRKNGFFVIPSSPSEPKESQIYVTYHGLPKESDRLGYMHCHDYFEMMYVYRGQCINKTPEQTYCLHEGDLVLLNPNSLHCPHVEHEEDILLNFHIPNDIVQQKVLPMLRGNPMFMGFFIDFFYRAPKSKRFLYFSNTPMDIRQMCDRMCLESFQKQNFYESVLDSSLIILFALLVREYQSSHQISKISAKDRQIYDILTYIEQNYLDVTLESLSKHFSYTPAYLSRFIKKQTGKNFLEIVQSQRMARVVQYLGSTDLPVIDIANLAGFSDIVYFNKVFKARFGYSPTEYRKRIRHE